MPAKLMTAAGGGITLDAASTATDKTITVPADNGTLVYANSSGNVGIGTSSNISGVKFQVKNTTNANFCVGSQYLGYLNDAGSSWANTSLNGLNVIFGVGQYAVEAARIDSSGNLLVGTTSAITGGVNGVQINGAGNTIFSRSSTGAQYQISFFNPNGSVGRIETNGSSTSYVTSSDYRLKENIQPMQDALSVVSALKPCSYTWKVDGSDGQGFIAHELAEVVPEAVVGEKDAVETYLDEEGNEQTRPVYQGIDTSFLVATLTAAIQELKAVVDAQAARIEALENK